MKIPIERPWSTGSPQMTGRWVASTMSSEIGTDGLEPCNGPPRPNRYEPIQ